MPQVCRRKLRPAQHHQRKSERLLRIGVLPVTHSRRIAHVFEEIAAELDLSDPAADPRDAQPHAPYTIHYPVDSPKCDVALLRPAESAESSWAHAQKVRKPSERCQFATKIGQLNRT
jgi:hypothetical protein